MLIVKEIDKIETRTVGTAVIFLIGLLLSALSYNAKANPTQIDKNTKQSKVRTNQTEPDTEVITIAGRRNLPNSEPNENTIKLLNVAGIDGDPLAAIFSSPGVVYAGGDFGGEPAIRGSSPDDNAFFIDSMPADYIFHLFGDSIFNQHLVRDFDLHAAAFPSQYGGATGGVFDVTLRDPRQQDIKTTVNVSLLKAGVFIEGSTTDTQAFYGSYRRSLIHLFLPEGSEDEGITVFQAPVSNDYQTKYQWLLGSEHKITLSANGASDKGGFNVSTDSQEGRANPDILGDAQLYSKFDTQALHYDYFGEKIYASVALNHVKSKDRESFGEGQFSDLTNKQMNFRANATSHFFEHHQLITGIDLQRNDFEYSYDLINYNCTDTTPDCVNRRGERLQDIDDIQVDIIGAYIIDKWSLQKDWLLELGLRVEKDSYTQESYLHPRINLSWQANNSTLLFARSGTYSRFPDVDKALPIIGNRQLKPFRALHYATGIEHQWNSLWSSKLELYYKNLEKLARATDEFSNDEFLNFTNDTSGTSYGAELLIEREDQNGWYGWASFSYSKSERTDDLTKKTIPYYLDTPWIVNVVANYRLSDLWEFGARLTARTGARYTPISGLQVNPDFKDNFLPVYADNNSATLPNYMRLDLQARYNHLPFSLQGAWTFAIINVLGNDNVSGYGYAPDGTESLTNVPIEAEMGISAFPSIGLEISF